MIADDLDVEGILEYARYVLFNASPLWIELDHIRKHRFQEVLFPDGITFDGKSFGTPSSGTVFNYLEEIVDKKEELVTPTGFEPVLPA